MRPGLLAGSLLLLFCSELPGQQISFVEVQGSAFPAQLESRAGEPYDPSVIQKDVKRLWETGRFEDIQVETEEEPEGTAVVFRVVEKQRRRLRNFQFVPDKAPLRMKLEKGTLIDRRRAQQVAAEVRNQLRLQGFTDAEVEPQLMSVSALEADMLLHVEMGERRKVDEVSFTGDLGVKPKELNKALKATRPKRIIPGIPGIWQGFRLLPDFSEDAVHSDLAQLRSFYLSKGYFDARVSLGAIASEEGKARIEYDVSSGPRYRIDSFDFTGGQTQPQIAADGEFPVKEYCKELFAERRDAYQDGVIDFGARLNVEDAGPPEAVNLLTTVERGPSYRVGRIEFRGHRAVSDSAVRRMMKLDESDLFDSTELRRSLASINRASFFEPLSEKDVVITTDDRTGRANVLVTLKERKRGRWALSGPVGPMSFAGPLQFSISSRLPAWGRGILEGSTYFASFTLLGFSHPFAKFIPGLPSRRFLPLFTLHRPLIPGQRWQSGFLIAPQLGLRGMALNYGISQAHNFLGPLIEGETGILPDLSIPVMRAGASPRGMLQCEPPLPRLHKLRKGAAMGINIFMNLRPF
ncbi:MAG: POTRA domain-containing protein [Bryobacteraceae bacterium]